MDNPTLIAHLRHHAKQLQRERANLYQIRAYRLAAEAIARLDIPLTQWLAQRGKKALQTLPGIGSHIAFAIECLLAGGEYHAMTEAAYRTPKDQRVANLPGIGPHFAQLLWEKLGVQSLAQFEDALRGQKLNQLPVSGKRQQQWLEAVRKQRLVSVQQAG
jgi:DNA polymerase/3'-5' exonuclease PolX